METTIPQLQAALAAGTVTSKDLVSAYLARIDGYDQRGPALNAISIVNGKALEEAAAMDAERRAGKARGLLHGIPIIVKDNYRIRWYANGRRLGHDGRMDTTDNSAFVKKLPWQARS